MDEHLKKEPSLITPRGSVLDRFEDDIRRGVELGVTQKEIKRWLALNGVEVGRSTIGKWLNARNITERRSKARVSSIGLKAQEAQQTNAFEHGRPASQLDVQKNPDADVSKSTEALTPWDPKRPKKVDFSKFHPK
jgi:hypothetical protein